jgi:hypothetical protein
MILLSERFTVLSCDMRDKLLELNSETVKLLG